MARDLKWANQGNRGGGKRKRKTKLKNNMREAKVKSERRKFSKKRKNKSTKTVFFTGKMAYLLEKKLKSF